MNPSPTGAGNLGGAGITPAHNPLNFPNACVFSYNATFALREEEFFSAIARRQRRVFSLRADRSPEGAEDS